MAGRVLLDERDVPAARDEPERERAAEDTRADDDRATQAAIGFAPPSSSRHAASSRVSVRRISQGRDAQRPARSRSAREGLGGDARMRVEDRELVAVVLEEPDLRLDLEPEPVRRGVGVPPALVADGPAVAQDDEPTGLVRRLLERVPLELAPDLSRDQHRTRRSRRTR